MAMELIRTGKARIQVDSDPEKRKIKLWERLSETIKADRKHINTVKESLVYRAIPDGARKRGNQHRLLGIRGTQKKVQSYQKE